MGSIALGREISTIGVAPIVNRQDKEGKAKLRAPTQEGVHIAGRELGPPPEVVEFCRLVARVLQRAHEAPVRSDNGMQRSGDDTHGQ